MMNLRIPYRYKVSGGLKVVNPQAAGVGVTALHVCEACLRFAPSSSLRCYCGKCSVGRAPPKVEQKNGSGRRRAGSKVINGIPQGFWSVETR